MISKEEMENKLDEVKVIEKEVAIIVNGMRNDKSKILVLKSDVDKYGTKTITLYGGLNGHGEWDDYFEDLSKIVKKLRENFNIWLIKLDNDCLDDKFDATFGIEYGNS